MPTEAEKKKRCQEKREDGWKQEELMTLQERDRERKEGTGMDEEDMITMRGM